VILQLENDTILSFFWHDLKGVYEFSF